MKRRTFLLSGAALAAMPALPKAVAAAPALHPDVIQVVGSASNSGGTIYWNISRVGESPVFPGPNWNVLDGSDDPVPLEWGTEYRFSMVRT